MYIYLQEKHTCTFLKQAKGKNLVIVVLTFNPKTWEAEAGDTKADSNIQEPWENVKLCHIKVVDPKGWGGDKKIHF